YLVDLLAPRREHDDRLVEALPAEHLADLEARELGQHDVQDHEVRLLGARALEAGGPVGGGEPLVALELGVVLEPQNHIRLVFHYQDLRHREMPSGWLMPRPSSA